MRTKEDILMELKRLDAQSGLSSSKLPIIISKAFKRLGAYYHPGQNREEHFRFASMLMDPDMYSDEVFRDTVRHEFAHYYCLHNYKYRVKPHGREWRQACLKFGANPSRVAERETEQHRQNIKDSYVQQNAKYIVTCPCCHKEYCYFRKGRIISTLLQDNNKRALHCSACGCPLFKKDLKVR